jgi:hypothetical protein
LRGFACAICILASTAASVVAQLPKIPMSFRIGPYGEMTSKPWLDPGGGARAVLSLASAFEIRADLGVRRPESTDSSGSLVGTATGSLQYNAWGGHPRNWGVFGGYQLFRFAEHGSEAFAGISTATSHARGEHVQYELSFGGRFARGLSARPVLRFKIIVLRHPPSFGRVPKPPPLDLHIDSVDAGGVPRNPRWKGDVKGKNVDRMCRFYYAQMSETPALIYRPECADSTFPTLNQPSPSNPKHHGLSCGVKNAEPIIRGHINWAVVSQTGRLRWNGYNGDPVWGDKDFTLFMDAPNLVTGGNSEDLIELEFSGSETTSLFMTGYGGRAWRPLIALPQLPRTHPDYSRHDASANRLLNNRPAIVTGLLGLDGEHDYHTELHPVRLRWTFRTSSIVGAMAIRMRGSY